MSRTRNSVKNIYTGVSYQVFRVFLTFITRTVFIHTLATEYLGINGLFSNVLTVLSLADLGIGDAIIYSLYKPIVENDEKKVSAIMNFFRTSYRLIGICILLIGLCLAPFLDNVITTNKYIPDLTLIYILYLSNTVSTYFFAYKRSLFIAIQKTFILNNIDALTVILVNSFQLIFLVLTHNFIGYLIIQIIFSYADNIVSSIIANKKFPFLKKNKHLKLTKKEKNIIYKNVKAMMYHKVGGVVLNSTDNLVISKFINIVMVGIYSNYTMLINSVSAFSTQFFTSLTASVGNLLVVESKEKSFEVFKVMFLINFWLYSIICIFLFNLMNPFINIWIGSKYLLDERTMILIVLNFYLVGMRQTVNMFKTTKGLFYKDRYKPIIESLLNLGLSLFFVKTFGVFGVLLGTFISFMLTSFLVDPYLVYRYIFNRKLRFYFYRYFSYTFIAVLLAVSIWCIMELFPLKDIYIDFVLKFILCVFVPNIVYFILFRKLDEFVTFKNLVIMILKKKNVNKHDKEVV
ncbi:lipopolysaccharide biosynthesis protein [Heyndrickxia acidicola]|uniref:Polysaccharide biosynthesis C-terminal domain-containing protein n=1 Tax=Heyndrickxia acidicola TaxID=209389 RepID=A0ABU6MB90_9BACI|nr:polysaccharide biosynthesis C-terminal domain-containing protein [Heyndrickxia acidicola]MED1201770.1 polysaccharide biosynthesis C-terminal domain-containing protein [Heyndrickxia acidicola]